MIHHSHIDIGYTHTITEISNIYQDYIDEILDEVDRIEAGISPNQGYKYVTEGFYIIENYLRQAEAVDIERLHRAIKAGYIEVTASYFNFTDTIQPVIYEQLVKRATDLGDQLGVPVTGAMFSDVNGFNYQYAQALANRQVKYLFTNVHSGHGIFGGHQKFVPFWWQLPDGKRLLVYNGELYTFGNEFGFCPRGTFSDVMSDQGYQAKSYNYDDRLADWQQVATKRFEEFLGLLEAENHPFDYVAMGLHGSDDDNGMPNPAIMGRIREWNRQYQDQVEVRLVSLNEFFSTIESDPTIPTHTGDWPDWWSDGVGSAPSSMAMFKRLQEQYLYFWEYYPALCRPEKESIEDAIAFFAEHTFGHFLSLDLPYLPEAKSIQTVKEAYIGTLINQVDRIKHRVYRSLGQSRKTVAYTDRVYLINPSAAKLVTEVGLRFDKFYLYALARPYQIVDSKGRIYRYRLVYIPELREYMPHILVELEANQKLEIQVIPIQEAAYEIELFEKPYQTRAVTGYDLIPDIDIRSVPGARFAFDRIMMSEDKAESEAIEYRWNEDGIYYIKDKRNGIVLVHQAGFGQPIYEIMPDDINPTDPYRQIHRRDQRIARVRRTLNSKRYAGKLKRVDLADDTPDLFRLILEYQLPDFEKYELIVTHYKTVNKLELQTIINQQYQSQRHNLLIHLPLLDSKDRLWLDRGGMFSAAWEDQLAGTLTEHNTVYKGVFIEKQDLKIALAMPDTPLIYLQKPRYQPAVLMHPQIRQEQTMALYCWPICTLWDCNFFRRQSQCLTIAHQITWAKDLDQTTAAEHLRQAALGVLQFNRAGD